MRGLLLATMNATILQYVFMGSNWYAGLKGIASDERIWKDFHLVRQVAARGELPIRVHTYLPLATWCGCVTQEQLYLRQLW